MSWQEFTTLLSGIMPETPLGGIVQIRSEEDPDILKGFTPAQHDIRNRWRSTHSATKRMSDAEKQQAVKDLQMIFAQKFG